MRADHLINLLKELDPSTEVVSDNGKLYWIDEYNILATARIGARE